MPKFPDAPQSNRPHMTQIPGSHPTDDVVRLDMARAEKNRREEFKKFQAEDMAEKLLDALEIEIEALHEKSKNEGAQDLTRKSLEMINKRIDQETEKMERFEKESFIQTFHKGEPGLMRKAAIMENEAREDFIEHKIRNKTDRLIETGDIIADEEAKIEIFNHIDKSDLPLEKKQDLSRNLEHQITLAAHKNRLRSEPHLRKKMIEGKARLEQDDLAQAALSRFAHQFERESLEESTQETYAVFKELDQKLAQEDASFEEVKTEAADLPSHLQDKLRQRDEARKNTAKLARTFQENPSDVKKGADYLTALIEGKDIISDERSRKLILGFATTYKIVPASVLEKLRRSSETAVPERLEQVMELYEEIEAVDPAHFSGKGFERLVEKATLMKILRSRFPGDKERRAASLAMIAPEKPLTPEDIETRHGAWLETEAALGPSGEREKDAYAETLRKSLLLTNGEREIALSVAEAMFQPGKKPDAPEIETEEELQESEGERVHDQEVNRAEKEDRLDNPTFDANNPPHQRELLGSDPKGRIQDEVDEKHRPYIVKLISENRQDLEKTRRTKHQEVDQNYINLFILMESTNRQWAANPQRLQTARGLGQFIEKTWFDLHRIYRKRFLKKKTEEFGLTLDKDGRLLEGSKSDLSKLKKHMHLFAFDKNYNREMLVELTAENKKRLEKENIPATEEALYIMHFNGATLGVRILKAKPIKRLDEVFGKDASKIRGANPDQLKDIVTIDDFKQAIKDKIRDKKLEFKEQLKVMSRK